MFLNDHDPIVLSKVPAPHWIWQPREARVLPHLFFGKAYYDGAVTMSTCLNEPCAPLHLRGRVELSSARCAALVSLARASNDYARLINLSL
jgi:hypothetical protein